MHIEEIYKFLNEYYKKLHFEIQTKDFNLYNIIFAIDNNITDIDYKYDNHLTITGNIYRIIEEIDKTILNYFKGD